MNFFNNIGKALDPKQNGVEKAFDPKQNGISKALDPTQNGLIQALDPAQNGVAKAFDPKESINIMNDYLKTGKLPENTVVAFFDPTKSVVAKTINTSIIEPVKKTVFAPVASKLTPFQIEMQAQVDAQNARIKRLAQNNIVRVLENTFDPNKNGVANAFDPNKNGVANAFDPNKNGVANAFDPDKNGLANFFKPQGKPEDPEKPEPEDNNTTLLLLGAGGLVLLFVLMQ